MKLTRRQSTLLSRLVTLSEYAQNRRLPIDVLEIVGFGSFFRRKPHPKDVDLLIRCTREHSRGFTAFRAILDHICQEVRYQYDFDRPLAAFLDEYDRRHTSMLPGLVSLDEERSLFAQWLQPYSWQMLFPKSIAQTAARDDPFGMTRRLLRRSLPNLNVVNYLYPDTKPQQIGLRAGFTEVIWTRERRDIQKNVLELFAPDRVQVNTEKELENFDRQLFLLQATRTVLESKVHRALGRPARSFSNQVQQTLQAHDVLLTEQEIEAELGLRRGQPNFDLAARLDVSDFVETRRTEVKELWWKVEAVREVGRILEWHQNGYNGPPMTTSDFVSDQLLSGKALPQQKFLRNVLQELGFDKA